MLDRRGFLRRSAAAVLVPTAAACSRPGPWSRAAYRKRERSQVALLKAAGYGPSLTETVRRGVKLCGVSVTGQRVVLKPNLVEFVPGHPAVTTNPILIAAAVEAFRQLGAREVIVAEGPGHRRDTEYLVSASGFGEAIRSTGSRWVDLNHDDVEAVAARSHFTQLGRFYLPTTIVEADLLVSMPKLKTHHWVGMTASLKNMFGILPGAIYGWPKNPLHWAGIHESVLDLNAALAVPQFAIVDGIVGMEGNGPIRGEPKSAGVLIFGDDLVAVDATAARLVMIEPSRIRYLKHADEFLGNLARERIVQVGEPLEPLRTSFRVLDSFKYLKESEGRLA
jgi:uncharacterized protein (DUF362 family)